MRYLTSWFLLVLMSISLSLTGCGSSSGTGTVSDPMASSTTGGTTTPPPSGSGTVLSYKLTLSTTAASGTGTTVGPNSTVIATAILEDSNGNPVANQPIKFEDVLKTGQVIINPITVYTDSNGKAVNFLKAGGGSSSAVDVILNASTLVNNQQLVTSLSIFKIQRSESNVIKFITTKNPTDPDGTLNTLAVTVENQPEFVSQNPLIPNARQILQLVPFEILDNNGVARTRTPVKISVYSQIGDCPVFIDSPETVEKTVTTDDSGIGIFNAGVTVIMPPVGSEYACSIIYKAEAADLNDSSKIIFAYGGFIASLKNVRPN